MDNRSSVGSAQARQPRGKCSRISYKNDQGFPGGSSVKNLPANTGDVGSIPGLGRLPGEGNGNSLQYSCLENSMAGGPWLATIHVVAESDTTEHTCLMAL